MAWGGCAEVHRTPSSVWLVIMDPLGGFSSISGRDILTRADQDGIHGIGPKPNSAGHCNFWSSIKGYPPIHGAWGGRAKITGPKFGLAGNYGPFGLV